MAKNIRALRNGREAGFCPPGVARPSSPCNLARAAKGPALSREKKTVIIKSDVDRLLKRTFTAAARRKVVRRLRRLAQTVKAAT